MSLNIGLQYKVKAYIVCLLLFNISNTYASGEYIKLSLDLVNMLEAKKNSDNYRDKVEITKSKTDKYNLGNSLEIGKNLNEHIGISISSHIFSKKYSDISTTIGKLPNPLNTLTLFDFETSTSDQFANFIGEVLNYQVGVTENMVHMYNYKSSTWSLMGNLYYYYNYKPNLNFYITGGMGAARHKLSILDMGKTQLDDKDYLKYSIENNNSIKPKTKATFAYNIGVGLELNMVKNLWLDLSARYLRYGSADIDVSDLGFSKPLNLVSKSNGFSYTVGLKYKF